MNARAIATAVAVALFGLPATAGAHAQLLRAEPADGATVATAPTALRLAFSEPVVADRATLDLYGSDGRHWRLRGRLGAATLTAAVPALSDGGYRLVWRSLSADDLHAVGGEVVFGVGAAAPAPSGRRAAEPPPAPGESALRWVVLALLALLQGALVLRLLGEQAAARMERLAAAGAAAAAAGLVGLEVRTAGSPAVVATSGAGRAAAVLVVGVAVAAALAPRRPRAALSAAAVAAAGIALGAHATAFGAVPAAVLAVHIVCATLWAGTVLAAAIALRRGSGTGLLRRLAPVLVPAVAGLAITGLLELGRHVATVDALLTTTYGRLIAVKTVLLLAAGALALGTRSALHRGAARPRRTVGAEATILLVALGAAAALAAGAPALGPRFMAPATVAPSVLETRQAADLLVSVEVRPNRPGASFITIRAIETRRPAPAPITGVRVAVGAGEVAARPTADGAWQLAGVELTRSGSLPLRIDVDRPGIPERVAVDWVVGGAPVVAPPLLSRRRLAPIATALAVVAAAVALLALGGSRRRIRAALALVLLGLLPATALAGTGDDVSVVVTLRGAPAAAAGAEAGGVERALRGGLDRRGAALRQYLAGRARRVEPLWIAHGYAVTAPASVVAALRRRPDVASVVADRTGLRPAAEPGIDLLQAPAVWLHAGPGALAGTTGEGVAVAVLDTGLDVDGPLAAVFRGRAADWFDAYGTYPTAADAAGPCSGHGTAVAGVIAGGSDDGGLAYGAAPGVRLLAARIFDGTCRASASAVHAALQWVLDPDGNPDTADAPAVVNASWGAAATGCDVTFEPDLVALRAAGIVVVTAAGNGGLPESPATLPEALAVGALAADGATARPDSGRGTSPCDGRSFPDLGAPGTDVRTADLGGRWRTVSGTSVAAPHVTALLALLLARHPGMTAAEQVQAATATAAPLGTAGTGAGRADALAAFMSALPPPRDRTAPILTAPSISPAITAGAPVVVHAVATDRVPGAAVAGTVASATVAVDGRPPAAVAVGAGGTLAAPVATAGLADGAHTAVLRAADDSGNVSRARTVAFTLDRLPPALGALELVRDDAGRVTGVVDAADRTRVVAVQASTGTVVAADGALGGQRETLLVHANGRGWAAGRHPVAVRARDAAGTWSAWRIGAVDVARLLRADGFENGLASWRLHGVVAVDRSSALAGHAGLAVRAARRPAYLEDVSPAGERTLTVGFLLRAGRIRGTVRLLELAGTGGTVAVELRRRGIRLRGGRWSRLGRRPVRITVALRHDRATLTVAGRAAGTVPAHGAVDTLRIGAVRGGAVTLALDAFRAVRD